MLMASLFTNIGRESVRKKICIIITTLCETYNNYFKFILKEKLICPPPNCPRFCQHGTTTVYENNCEKCVCKGKS